MRSCRMMLTLASIILALPVFGCGEEEIATIDENNATLLPEGETAESEEIEEEVPESGMPQPIKKVIDKLQRGVEEEDMELYLEAFWADDYSYRSDSGTDDPLDDVTFDNIQEERESLQRLFAAFDDFDIKFKTKEFAEVDRAEAEVRSHYKLLASIGEGHGLPGGHQKVFAEGDNIFTFEKRGDEWRISRWEQEEMSVEEIKRAYAELNIRPPEALITKMSYGTVPFMSGFPGLWIR